jgi:hypothetical protein
MAFLARGELALGTDGGVPGGEVIFVEAGPAGYGEDQRPLEQLCRCADAGAVPARRTCLIESS